MATARAETPKAAPEAASEKGGAQPAPAAAGGGIKAWLPLLANIVLMPILAWGTFRFLILPKMQPGHAGATASGESHGKEEEKSGSQGGKQAGQVTVPLGGKVIVNVAGTMGTRYLLAQLTLVSKNAELKTLVEKHDAALRDAAASALSSKTIADLEKPGARNLIRSEVISVFNNILGDNTVSDIYLTEFAIQ